ncbi:MAG: helix-turn-helix transcriptional regulator, partial [Acidobacteriota bacterium]
MIKAARAGRDVPRMHLRVEAERHDGEIDVDTIVLSHEEDGRPAVVHLLSSSIATWHGRDARRQRRSPHQVRSRRPARSCASSVSSGTPQDTSVAARVSARTVAPSESNGEGPASRLSPREVQILDQLSIGSSTKEIARALSISPVTVRNHIRSILKKLGVHRRLDAVLMRLH